MEKQEKLELIETLKNKEANMEDRQDAYQKLVENEIKEIALEAGAKINRLMDGLGIAIDTDIVLGLDKERDLVFTVRGTLEENEQES